MPVRTGYPTACKARTNATLELRRKKSPIRRPSPTSHQARPSVAASDFSFMKAQNLGFRGRWLGRHGSVVALPSQTRCQHCSQPLLQISCLRERPESQHALPCSQVRQSPRGADTSSKEPPVVNPHHSSSANAQTATADVSTAARASTGAQHRRTTNKKHRPAPRPRALRRSIMLPTGERRRGTLPLHQRRRGRIKRLRVLQLDRMVVFTSDDTDVLGGGALYLTL